MIRDPGWDDVIAAGVILAALVVLVVLVAGVAGVLIGRDVRRRLQEDRIRLQEDRIERLLASPDPVLRDLGERLRQQSPR